MTDYRVWSLKRGAINPAEPIIDSEYKLRQYFAAMEELAWQSKRKAEKEYA